jgi:hypothetical protein
MIRCSSFALEQRPQLFVERHQSTREQVNTTSSVYSILSLSLDDWGLFALLPRGRGR